MDLGLQGARILVCAGSRGLGAGAARVLAAEGARLAICARASDDLRSIGVELGASVIEADLSSEDGPASAVVGAAIALGGLDGMVVSSGGPPSGRFDELDDARWEVAFQGTLMSVVRLIRAALPHLRDAKDPAVVTILSSSVREPIPGLITSNGMRPALVGILKTLVSECAPVRFNGIAPGRIATGRVASLDIDRARRTGATVEAVRAAVTARIPLGRYGEAEEVGRVIAFLISPAASYVNGAIVAVDGGMIQSLP